MDYSPNCMVCELYKTSACYKVDRAGNSQRKADILLVGSVPPSGNDPFGGVMENEAGAYLKKWLQWWDGTWAYTTVVKCATPDGADPKPHQVEACRKYLQEDIEAVDPQVIIALGGVALKALWPDGPGSIVKAKGAPIQIGSRWMIANYHPSMHISGRQDLTAEYTRVFELATQICEGRYGTDKPDIREVREQSDFETMIRQLSRAKEITLDVENPTTNMKDDPSRYTFWMCDPAVVCLGVGTDPKEPVWVMRRQWVTQPLLSLMSHKTLVGANVKHDLCALAWDVWPGFLDAVVQFGGIEDTMLWHGSRDQNEWGNGLKEMAEKYLGAASWVWPVRQALDAERGRVITARREQRNRIKQARKNGRPEYTEESIPLPTFCDVPWPTLLEYNGKDVWYTMRLLAYLRENLPPAPVYETLLKPGTPNLARMELLGVGADPAWRSGLELAYAQKVEQLRQRLHEFPEIKRIVVRKRLQCVEGEPKTWFNPKSGPHKEALVEECGMEVTEKTETGKPKTDKRVVAEFVKQGFEVWRYVEALTVTRDRLSKFVVPLKHHIVRDNRIHASFKPIKVRTSSDEGSDYSGGTESGRMSLADPPMHNQVKDPIFRRMFVPLPGHVFLELDHGAIEVRGVAHLSDCKALIEMFSDERDVYVRMAELMFHKEGLTKKSPERNLAKTGTLAKIYRQGAAGLAARAGIYLHEAVEFQQMFDRRFPDIEGWQQELIKSARAGEMYVTPWGRQWTFEDGARDNEIVNRPVQSFCTDLCWWQAIHVQHRVRQVMFTHDSHLLEVPKNQALDMARLHKAWMEDRSVLPVAMNVPLVTECKMGSNLGQMKEITV